MTQLQKDFEQDSFKRLLIGISWPRLIDRDMREELAIEYQLRTMHYHHNGDNRMLERLQKPPYESLSTLKQEEVFGAGREALSRLGASDALIEVFEKDDSLAISVWRIVFGGTRDISIWERVMNGDANLLTDTYYFHNAHASKKELSCAKDLRVLCTTLSDLLANDQSSFEEMRNLLEKFSEGSASSKWKKYDLKGETDSLLGRNAGISMKGGAARSLLKKFRESQAIASPLNIANKVYNSVASKHGEKIEVGDASIPRLIAQEQVSLEKVSSKVLFESFKLHLESPILASKLLDLFVSQAYHGFEKNGDGALWENIPMLKDEIDVMRKDLIKPLSMKLVNEAKAQQGMENLVAIQAARAFGIRKESLMDLVGEARKVLIEKEIITPAAWKAICQSESLAASLIVSLNDYAETQKSYMDRRKKAATSKGKNLKVKDMFDTTARYTVGLQKYFSENTCSLGTTACGNLMSESLKMNVAKENIEFCLQVLNSITNKSNKHESGAAFILNLLSGKYPVNISTNMIESADLEQIVDECSFIEGKKQQICKMFIDAVSYANKRLPDNAGHIAPEHRIELLSNILLEEFQLIADCVRGQPFGFFGTLPPGFTFKTLKKLQEKWHEEFQNSQAMSNDKGIRWEPILKDNIFIKDKYMARDLISSTSLLQEGEAMSHCVGSYWDRCVTGEFRILSVSYLGSRHCTLQLSAVTKTGASMHLGDLSLSALSKFDHFIITQNKRRKNHAVTDEGVLSFCNEVAQELTSALHEKIVQMRKEKEDKLKEKDSKEVEPSKPEKQKKSRMI